MGGTDAWGQSDRTVPLNEKACTQIYTTRVVGRARSVQETETRPLAERNTPLAEKTTPLAERNTPLAETITSIALRAQATPH